MSRGPCGCGADVEVALFEIQEEWRPSNGGRMSVDWMILNHAHREYIDVGVLVGQGRFANLWFSPLVMGALNLLLINREEWDSLIIEAADKSGLRQIIGRWHNTIISIISSDFVPHSFKPSHDLISEYMSINGIKNPPVNDYELSTELYTDISALILDIFRKESMRKEIEELLSGSYRAAQLILLNGQL